jgi:hypothetical protein
VWKDVRTTSPTTDTKRPETRAFHRGRASEEEISTAVDEAVEYFGKVLETA